MLAPGAAEVLAAVERAHPSATISFDPNCRPSIIPTWTMPAPRPKSS